MDETNDHYSRPFRAGGSLRRLRSGEAYWGSDGAAATATATAAGAATTAAANTSADAEAGAVRRLPTDLRRRLRTSAERLADGIFGPRGVDTRHGSLSFIQLRRLFRRAGFLSTTIVPQCLSYPAIGAAVDPTGPWRVRSHTAAGVSAGSADLGYLGAGGSVFASSVPLPLWLSEERLAAFSFGARLNNTVSARRVSMAPHAYKTQRWDDPNNGRVLQCLVTSGLLYARAALACLRSIRY